MAENVDIQKLKLKKRMAKSGFTRVENFMKTIQRDNVDVEEVKLRLNKVEELRKTLEESLIELAIYDNETSEEQIEQEIANYEEKYINLKLTAEKIIQERVRPDLAINLEQAIAEDHTGINNARNRANEGQIKLPKIDLPTFNGLHEEWYSFFGIFDSLIHSNTALNDIQKFHYLKAALKGEAAEIIESLEITRENYCDAWSRLKERYDNERVIVQKHIKAIFELPTIKKENSVALRNLLDGLLKHVRALTALKRPVKDWDDLLVYIVASKLDYFTTKEWENSVQSKQSPTFKELTEFLTRRCETLEAVARRSQSVELNNRPRQTNSKVTTTHAALTESKCAHCKGDHRIYQCKSFKELSISDRFNKIKALKLCLNCLKDKHLARNCTAGNCKKCAKRHSSLLHDDQYSAKEIKEDKDKSNSGQQESIGQRDNTICTYAQPTEGIKPTQVLLTTATILVLNDKGQYLKGRVLLDNGSQSNFVTEEFVKKLNMKTKDNYIEIRGINQHVSSAIKSIDLHVTSRFKTFSMDIQCIILPKITQNLPLIELNATKLDIPKNIQLADPHFNIPSKIDMLIGAERFWELLNRGQIKLGKNKPVLQKSVLGWLISGPVNLTQSNKGAITSCNLSTTEELNQNIKKFWEVDNYTAKGDINTEEEHCEKLFKVSYTRTENGRFIVKLPVKEKILPLLKNSREVALKRFLTLEKKFAKQPKFKAEYIAFMREYQQLGHMKAVNINLETKFRVFLPHHAVIKQSSSTTKTRVVFDASSTYSQGKSLNDALYKGPILQADLFSLIIQFRGYKYVLCADIEKMYRQVLIDKEQTPLQSVVWREDSSSKIQDFELLTITYGTKPASFLAVKCLHQLADSEEANYPEAAATVRNNFYMDDLLTGGNTKEEITKLKRELTELLEKGGFKLHKWRTNAFISNKNEHTTTEKLDIVKERETRLLGILWNPQTDKFQYEVSLNERDQHTTKRAMLSQVCKLFDPLGLVGPVVTAAKILMQTLWNLGIEWDEAVPPRIYQDWNKIKTQLHLLNDLKITRPIVSGKGSNQLQLHGFCDASERAYGACIYLREKDEGGNTNVRLICSKSRVAPMKALSLPRLELCGSVLLVELMKRVTNSLGIKIEQKFFWTDSKIVLAWINSPSRRWQVFVANRVSEIHSESSASEWKHVDSKDNPADLISRGMNPKELIKTNIWWNGPSWLSQNSSCWPKEAEELLLKNPPEERKQTVVASVLKDKLVIEYVRFSSYYKLLRVGAYVLRFIYNARHTKEERKVGVINTKEVREAKLMIIKLVQTEEFLDDIKAIRLNNKVKKNSKLISLLPYVDNEGVLKIGGRLKHASLPEETRHQIILPARHHFTKLVVIYYHEKLFHAGVQTTLNCIREEFWPIFARNLVKKILHECIKCKKASPRPSWQLLGQLPPIRVTPARPFYNTGIDYCGPFLVRDRTRRNSKRYKAYVAIFVCMVVKAVHIELVEDLTTDSFIAALKRFTARRGKVKNIYSDNGRNFVGADRALQKTLESKEFRENIMSYATTEQITWHFIPARSPHFGGLWEAAVRILKLHMKRTIGDACLTIAEMTTVLTQVEAMLNSRPLTPLTEDPNDLRALTPGHFLIGENLQSHPDLDITEVPENRLSRWQHVEQLRQRFWSRWQKEYLTMCQQRNKWRSGTKENFKIGQLVMLKDSENKPLKWSLGKIIEVHPGSDGIVRTVTIKTSQGAYKRSIVNIAPCSE